MANSKVHIPNPTTYSLRLPYEFRTWLQRLHARLGEGPFLIRGYSASKLPPAAQWGDGAGDFSSLIYVADEAGGAVLAFSDGTNWRRVTDRAVVS